MQTNFTPAQLQDPATAEAAGVIRKCVHCGFCTATCPTYALLGDELDSPRGRIYLIKEMLEAEADPAPEVVKHVDRCLSCLSCMTTCPSGVNYMHLVDHARAYIEARYRRPPVDRMIRALLAHILPYPGRLRLALRLARPGRFLLPLLNRWSATKPLAAMIVLAPRTVPRRLRPEPTARPGKGRVIILEGCAEPVLKPEYRNAATRLMVRAGYEVATARDEGCCGALVHHLGREEDGLAAARRNVDAWMREIEDGGLAAIVVTASGCGTTIKDYGYMLRHDPLYADRARQVSALARDVSEFLAGAGLIFTHPRTVTVAYQAACSLQHGQQVRGMPENLLRDAGYQVVTPAEPHMCCGSAGTYNILQPEISGRLGARKVDALERLSPHVIATGNVGCAIQIGARAQVPVVHIVELLDWAMGGPEPAALTNFNRGEKIS